ncbi:MAG: IS256 family transposase [bacterium]|nr:IS256 family transposase [bacterium]
MASRTKLLTDLTLTDLWKEVKDPATLWGDLTLEAQRTLKLLLQNRMHEELTAYLHAPRYRRVRARQGVRNGRYVRALTTTWGTIPNLEIPRAREKGFVPSVLPRYQRRMPEVDRLIQAVFLAGISTRRVGRTLAEILGDTVSASTVSAITRTLDHAVAAWHRRPIQDEYRYLILDGLSLRVKTPDGTKRRLILVAYGITQDGRRRVIDYRLAKTESQGAWEGFLINLAARGLVGERLALITTDGHRGLHAALELVYPTAPRQACWVHVLRNVAQRLRVRDRERCLTLARRIYEARSRPAAETALRQWARLWEPIAPAAVACLLRDWEALLAFYTVPQRDWRKTRTTNAIERAFREVRRRTSPMTCFTNDASCDRITYAVVHNLNEQWQGRPLW